MEDDHVRIGAYDDGVSRIHLDICDQVLHADHVVDVVVTWQFLAI